MKFEEIEYESVITSHIKIFVFLASKYVSTILGYEMDDLIHEQIIECYKRLDKCMNKEKVGSYIYAVSENRLKSIYRNQTRLKRKPKYLIYLETASSQGEIMQLAETTNSIEDTLYVKDSYRRADLVAKDVLSKFEYYVYKEYVGNQKNMKEIACECGKSSKQVQNAMSRIRKKLSEKRGFILNEI